MNGEGGVSVCFAANTCFIENSRGANEKMGNGARPLIEELLPASRGGNDERLQLDQFSTSLNQLHMTIRCTPRSARGGKHEAGVSILFPLRLRRFALSEGRKTLPADVWKATITAERLIARANAGIRQAGSSSRVT